MIVLFIWIILKVGNLFNLLCYYNLGIVEFYDVIYLKCVMDVSYNLYILYLVVLMM